MVYEKRGGLLASKHYWEATELRRSLNCNGCGTEGWKGALVPDTIWGLDVNPACNIHDWDYAEGTTPDQKNAADFRFQKNMIALIRQSAKRSWTGWVLKIPREYRAFTYYVAVSESDASVNAFKDAELVP